MFEIQLSSEVAEAITARKAVVALESTLLAHGLPRPGNHETARALEDMVRRHGATPATIAVLDGVGQIGLSAAQLLRVCSDPELAKLSIRDATVAAGLGRSGATTVASTAALARAAGISVFATGGLGGVHRGARDSFDESADLVALSRTRIVIVCAGVKSILDVPATLERLETLSVSVVGYQSSVFPGFYTSDSGSTLEWRCESPEEVAQVFAAGDGFSPAALVVANPLPIDRQLDPGLHDAVIASALASATDAGIRGKAITPYVLNHLHVASEGRTQAINVDLVLGNAALAAQIAVAYNRSSS